MKTTKKWLAALLAAMMVLSMAGCGGGESSSAAAEGSSSPAAASSQDSEESEAPASSAAQESAVDVKKLADDMYAAMTFDDEMMELSAEVLPNIYEYDPEEVVDFKVYTCATGGSADEVAVFLADDDAGMEYIEQMVGYRLDTLRSNFEDYRPEEMSKIDNAKVLTNGYVTALVVSNDTSGAEEVFNSAF